MELVTGHGTANGNLGKGEGVDAGDRGGGGGGGGWSGKWGRSRWLIGEFLAGDGKVEGKAQAGWRKQKSGVTGWGKSELGEEKGMIAVAG